MAFKQWLAHELWANERSYSLDVYALDISSRKVCDSDSGGCVARWHICENVVPTTVANLTMIPGLPPFQMLIYLSNKHRLDRL